MFCIKLVYKDVTDQHKVTYAGTDMYSMEPSVLTIHEHVDVTDWTIDANIFTYNNAWLKLIIARKNLIHFSCVPAVLCIEGPDDISIPK